MTRDTIGTIALSLKSKTMRFRLLGNLRIVAILPSVIILWDSVDIRRPVDADGPVKIPRG